MSFAGNRFSFAFTLLFLPLLAHADNVLHPGSPVLDRPTLMTLGVQLPITGDDNYNATVTVRYRQVGATAWSTGLPLYRVHPNTVYSYTVSPQFAGSIFDLRPNTSYQIELHAVDPDGPVDQTFDLTATTRAVPADPQTPRQVSVIDVASLKTAIANARPGDIITLANGFYSGSFFDIMASGTAANPIVIRGTSQSGVIIDGANCSGCNIFDVYGSYIHIEQLTLENAQRAIRFYNTTTENVIRRVHIQNVIIGISGYENSGQTDFYIADNILEGRLQWPLVYASDNGLHANDDGIQVTGSGMVVAHNRLSGFGDATKTEQTGARAVDFYGNDVLWTYDNAVELDGSEGNARCMRNRYTNTWDTISVQPIYAGPAYIFRNVVVNAADEQIKFHALGVGSPYPQPNGVFAYHNTFVSPNTELQVQTSYASHHFALENNLFIAQQNLPGYAVNWEAPIDDGTFDYNGWFPNGKYLFNWMATGYNTYANFAALQAAGVETHGRQLVGQIFASGFTAPTTYTNLVSPQDVTLKSSGPGIDAGLVLPNINDNYTGAAPDLGAAESGCPSPIYGPRPVGTDESNEPLGCLPSSTGTTPPPPSNPPPTFTPIRVNAGGGAYVDASGNAWSADAGYTGGNPYSVSHAIANTTAQPLYQACRWGAFNYTFAVPNGSYNVVLKFAEVSRFAPGQREFNVAIDGIPVLTNFDIFAQAGGAYIALDKTFPVTVTTGQIVVQFSNGAADAPMVNAIDIEAAGGSTPPPSASAVRIDSGGPAVTDASGNIWAADKDVAGGTPWSVTNAISNTAAPALYQTCRWGAFTYTIPVTNGNYNVILKFAEVSRFAAGQREFNVTVNGTQVLTNFDIFAQAGGAYIALDKTFPVSVANGQITIQFTYGAADAPMVNAIDIEPAL